MLGSEVGREFVSVEIPLAEDLEKLWKGAQTQLEGR
jgi:hypothetical protein